MTVRRLDQLTARRVAVRAQLLDAQQPRSLLDTISRLMFLQLDPTAAVAPSADLVAWSRLGSAYRPDDLKQALEQDRALFEHVIGAVTVRPMADLGLYLAEMSRWPERTDCIEWLKANGRFHRFVLDLLRDCGPLRSREIPDRSQVPWPSSGWTNNRNVTQLLEFLTARGEVAVSARRGRERLWDIAERVYPTDVPVLSAGEARVQHNERRLRALGIARSAAVGEAGEAAEVSGTPGVWRIDPAAVEQPFSGRTALLSPFDQLVHDRRRALELFGFEYTLEIYKPKAKRRWGYFALPVLHHDRLVGKVDATVKGAALNVQAIHRDVPFTRGLTAAVDAELDALAAWLGLTASRVDQVPPSVRGRSLPRRS